MTDYNKMDHPGVKFPPPLIQLSYVVFGRALEWGAPLTAIPESGLLASRILGVFLMGFALGIILIAAGKFRSAKTRIEPWKPSSTILDTGIYSVTRNPIYLAFQIFHLGVAFVIPSVWVALMIVPAMTTIRYYVIAREERYLEGAFGEPYLAYKRKVRRWL